MRYAFLHLNSTVVTTEDIIQNNTNKSYQNLNSTVVTTEVIWITKL